jgi:hypothetical protein
MRVDRAWPPLGQLLGLIEEAVSATGSREQKGLIGVGDKRLYLPSTGQVGDLLYSNTWEAVRTLERPIRGIDMRQSIRWIYATSMMG